MQVLVLSPHRDDAAFSCGYLLYGLLQAGHSLRIVNVFTISSYAPYLAQSEEDRTHQVSKARLEEDLRFVDLLARTTNSSPDSIGLIDLGWMDLPLRWQVDDADTLAAGPLRSHELETLQAALRVLPAADLVLCPRALGGHVDHRLVCRAAQTAFAPASLVFYEDLPYACGPLAKPSSEIRSLQAMQEAWLPAEKMAHGLKHEFCVCYPSQIDQATAETMERYGQVHGGEHFTALPNTLQMLRSALHEAGAAA